MSEASHDNAAALNPRSSCVVEACAGSGKTWLLVSRMLRLLLAGARPSELLAITFTNKAAQEMASRLNEWLQILATAKDDDVRQFLKDRKLPEHEIDALLPRARGLLETVAIAQPGPCITTFHGWFLNLLRRAPLEAGLPWGAPLLERERQLRDEVLERLLSKWAATPDSPEGQALLALLEDTGEANLKSLLSHFMQTRLEWLAYSEGQADPLEHALSQLQTAGQIDSDADPLLSFWSDASVVASVRRVGFALQQGSKTERERACAILQSVELEPHAAFDALMKHLMTSGKRRKTQATTELKKALGAGLNLYLTDLANVEFALEEAAAAQSKLRIWKLNQYGLMLGHALLQAYQQAKADRGVIDFADAEWLACQLLESEDHAPALNLKLDARYRHLLLDEFQDTNPLQWRALSAWLSEARAADADMTVFMVGDPKQAIYRFRRGEARVFEVAANFLQTHFQAARLANNQTRRLAPTVVQAINPLFSGVTGFAEHQAAAEHVNLPGAVRAVLVEAPENGGSITHDGLRNPLITPLAEAADKAVHEEARQFARTLKQDILGNWAISEKGITRAARFGDVMGLVRKRTHLKIYEQALEDAGIPFITSRRGGLLHALEAQDLIALLETLLLPHADLKLAHVLKSPLMSCSDAELLQVFRPGGEPGWDRLTALAASTKCTPSLVRAFRLLECWRADTGILPVHDLLDRIYHQGDVEARYAAAAPPAMRPQIAANLRAFMQLALTQDAGRYPSLGGFIRELKLLVDDTDAAPEEGIAAEGENAVRLLTIHGAKGLEAPIVWLLGGAHHAASDHHDVLAPWLPDAPRPAHFSLYGRREDRGAFREKWFAEEEALDLQEETNLLYVAVTRAKQGLIVSGDARRNQDGEIKHPWLKRIDDAWSKTALPPSLPAAPMAEETERVLPACQMLARPVGLRQPEVAASLAGVAGEFFHACLEHHAPPGKLIDLAALATKLGLPARDWRAIEREALALIGQPGLSRFFDPAAYVQARNELEILTADGVKRIDRLVEFTDELWVLDYKTGEVDAAIAARELIARHGAQLDDYRRAVEALWPHKPARAALLLKSGKLIQL